MKTQISKIKEELLFIIGLDYPEVTQEWVVDYLEAIDSGHPPSEKVLHLLELKKGYELFDKLDLLPDDLNEPSIFGDCLYIRYYLTKSTYMISVTETCYRLECRTFRPEWKYTPEHGFEDMERVVIKEIPK